MNNLSFKKFYEMTDIFGFEKDKHKDEVPDAMLSKPLYQFDLEEMINLLAKKKIGTFYGIPYFTNEIRWGERPGAVKLEVDTGYTFFIKKLATDRQGNPRWITKKSFQLNRNGYGGYEDSVAQEVFETIKNTYDGNIELPPDSWENLDNLVMDIYGQMKRCAKPIFIPEGIKKLSEHAYILKLGVRAQGVEARDHNRVEQNQTLITYDPACGTIRVMNYNLLSPVGGTHEFKINQNDLDLYFFPSQARDEISDAIATHFRYY